MILILLGEQVYYLLVTLQQDIVPIFFPRFGNIRRLCSQWNLVDRMYRVHIIHIDWLIDWTINYVAKPHNQSKVYVKFLNLHITSVS